MIDRKGYSGLVGVRVHTQLFLRTSVLTRMLLHGGLAQLPDGRNGDDVKI